MKTKHKLILAYFAIAAVFGLYGWLWGDASYRGLPYNLGRGLIWPALLFPALGNVASVLILLAVIALIAVA